MIRRAPAPALAALVLCAVAVLPTCARAAVGDRPFVAPTGTPGDFRLVAAGIAAPIVVDARDFPGVRRAAGDLQQDVERVSGVRPRLLSAPPSSAADVVVVGTLGHSDVVDALVRRAHLDVAALRGTWESSIVQVVPHPWPGVARALLVAGSDKRGTIFAAYDVSEQIGVSPWYWWADVPVRHRDDLFVRAGRYARGEPAVRYRGLFINDEAPALSGWARARFGGFTHEFYAKVFELLLRLRANFLWPAMWGSAFADDDPQNPVLADEYGIVIGTSHHEPMTRAHDEWRRYGHGPWNYATNADALREFWTAGIRRHAGFERIVTLGMRGDGDEPMSEQANVALLERIVGDQRAMIAANGGPGTTAEPQVWALYKEVQDYYERGMRVPDDVTLLWSDDNWGNIRRLPTPAERGRAGGAGVYYHFDYVGGPRSYKWLNTVPIPKIWEQMRLAWRQGATRIWIVNVGDIKPMEVPIQFFLDYAWDPAAWPAERLPDYTRAWAEREFGPEHATEIGEIVDRYTMFNGRRKPEMLDPRTYSLVNYREAESVVDDYQQLARRAQRVFDALPAAARDAFDQLVRYPVTACATLNDLVVTAGANRLFATQGRTSTNDLAERARTLFDTDASLTRHYNEEIAGGKWRHLMDQTHIGYTFWNHPVRNAMPAVQLVQPSAGAEMGVAIEGSEASWPVDNAGPAVLPPLSVYSRAARYLEIFNRGREPFTFAIETSQPWLQVDVPRGTVTRDQRVWVSARWEQVPVDAAPATLTVTGPNGVRVAISVPVQNPAAPRNGTGEGFVEVDRHVAMEAAHFARAVAPTGARWITIPGHGRTLSGVTLELATPGAESLADADAHLEYPVVLFTTGTVHVQAYLSPTQKFRPGAGFRYGISFDAGPMEVVDVHADASAQAWERSVADGVTRLTSTHALAKAGPHVLTFHLLDPGLVLQKLVIDAGGVRPSYLGPPESPRVPAR